jgi:hypothetical protein
MYDRGEIVSIEEQRHILLWLSKNYFRFIDHNPNFVEAAVYEDNPTIPRVIWDIRERIIKKEGLEEYAESYNENFFLKFHNTLKGVTRDKIFVLTSGEGGNLDPHKDINQPCLVHTRFNVFLNLPKYSHTYYDGHRVEAKERHYVLCRSGMDLHWTDPIHPNDNARIAISYGFQLPPHVLNKIYKIPRIRWISQSIRIQLYKYLENVFGFHPFPLHAALKCDSNKLSSIPTKPYDKNGPDYKNRPRGVPPFLTEERQAIYSPE